MQSTLKQTSLVSFVFALLIATSLACSVSSSPTQAPPITQVVQITQVVPVTQPSVPVTQIVAVTQIVPVTQIVSPAHRDLQATFFGQDGGSYAGQLCETGTTVIFRPIISQVFSPKVYHQFSPKCCQ